MKSGITNDKLATSTKAFGAKQSIKNTDDISSTNDSPTDIAMESTEDSQAGDTQPTVSREESPDWDVPVDTDNGETQLPEETQLIECKF